MSWATDAPEPTRVDRMPSISWRQSIRWADEPIEEPTSTLVLTTPLGNFVDIRALRPSSYSGDINSFSAAPAEAKLEWAFAGLSESKKASGDEPAWGRWTHWVDSLKPSGYQDEGQMWTQEDGTTLEKGSMENPATGKVEPYEEVWEDPQPERVGDRLRYDCLKLDREEERKKGMIVRVGQYVQGILVEEVEGGGEKKVVVERWKREGGTWKRLIRYGTGNESIPCACLFGDVSGVPIPEDRLNGWEIVESRVLNP